MRHAIKMLIGAFAVLLGTMAVTAPASAQATKTWVSGVGDDANPCSRTAPCKTFAGAISKTAAGGEISCLDPAGYGAVTITKAITIECDTTIAGVLASGTNGVVVNAGVTDVVILSGLDFDGFGTGLRGVYVLKAGGVVVRNSTIRGFRGSTGSAINFAASNVGAALTVENVTMVANGNAAEAVTGAIVAIPSAPGATTVSINNVQITGNLVNGIYIAPTGAGSSVKGSITNSLIAGSGNALVAAAGTNAIDMIIKDNVVTGNSNAVTASDAGTSLLLDGNRIAGNSGTAISASAGARIFTYSNNVIVANTANGAFTGTATRQ